MGCELSFGKGITRLASLGPMGYIVVLVTSYFRDLPAPRRCSGRQEPKLPPSSRSSSAVHRDFSLGFNKAPSNPGGVSIGFR
jgi:hypothetical protein